MKIIKVLAAVLALTGALVTGGPAGADEPDPARYGRAVWADAPAEDRAQSRVLRIYQERQHRVRWDWAAAASTVARYYGKRLGQNHLCNAGLGRRTDSACPAVDADLRAVRKALRSVGVEGGTLREGPLDAARLREEIDAGRPVIAEAEGPGGTRHVFVVHGYNTRQGWVYWGDPWPTAKRYNWAHLDVFNQGLHLKLTGALTGVGPGAPREHSQHPLLPHETAQEEPGSSDGMPASRTARMLKINMRTQERDGWSWAASGTSIAELHGKHLTQNQWCNLARHVPLSSAELEQACPDEPVTLGAEAAPFPVLGMRSRRLPSSLSFDDLRAEIDAGRPVLSNVQWPEGGGHAQVIFGYDAEKKLVFWGDPWPTAHRYNWATYDHYVGNTEFRWTSTVQNIDVRTQQPEPAENQPT
ncbi:papain-like cysteine protease family protein [Spirillospora sp. CA-294931]|uniref:papain-like cysteine protease family protein n=1 Tax=Spirillospora sp. CA-294931 TaxID=3240042 RepID=UPI003D90F85F